MILLEKFLGNNLNLDNNQKNLFKRYLAYEATSNLFFVGAIWLHFYRIYITDQQIGIMDGMAFLIGLLAEIPSGALADKFGKSRIVRLGQILAGIGLLIQAFATSFMPFFVGQSIMMIGIAFTSGADEALFYSKFNFEKASHDWKIVLTKASQAGLIATLFAVTAGGLMYSYNPQLPWILTAIGFLTSAIIIWSIKDERTSKKEGSVLDEVRDYLNQIKVAFLEFSKRNFLLYVPIIIIVQGLFYTTGWGVLRLMLLDRFNYSPFMGSIAISACTIITIFLLSSISILAKKFQEKHILVFVSILAGLALLISIFDIGMWGFIVILALYVGDRVLHPFINDSISRNAQDHLRATTLSVASFLRTLPYLGLAPIIGYLNTHQELHYFLLIWPILIVLSALFYLSQLKK